MDLGISKNDGTLLFQIEDTAENLKRIVAGYRLKRARQIRIDDDSFSFEAGETIRLFFSYRYTPERIRALLASHKLHVHEQWMTKSGEEGVFLCRRVGETPALRISRSAFV
jgi:uncharacterized SAM-dependent methyltransferase